MNKDELKAYQHAQYMAHREERIAYAKNTYAADREHILRQRKEAYAADKEKYALKYKAYKATERGRKLVNQHNKKWRAANLEKAKAQRKVNYQVSSGQFPSAGTMVCDVCQEALAHHWHHHNGYGPGHEIDVIAICRPCHYEAHRPKEE